MAVGAILIFAVSPGRAALVAGSVQSVAPGQTVISSFGYFSQGQQVAAMQFDVDWDPVLDVKPVLGDRVRQAAKIAYAVPQGPRTVRFILIGLNQDAFTDGELLKTFVIVSSSAPAGVAQIRLQNLVASDPFGGNIELRGELARLQVQGSPASISLLGAGVLNAASLTPGPISPGEIITLLGDVTPANPSIWINGTATPILFAGAHQINAIVPFGIDLAAPATLDLRSGSTSLAKLTTPVAAATPAVFTQTGAGSGPGAILNEDLTLNTYFNPALRGSTVMIYGTGFGLLTSTTPDGASVDKAIDLQVTPTVTIGGIPALVRYSGTAPGLVAGLTQLNVEVPPQLTPSLSAPVVVTSAGSTSAAGLTIAVK
jgi:uncharacterized protein (TIGR03437 family)